ncbi:hypothetical protein L1987_85496 [Smallanthus sonchifolius]|uniref:Uncharacterized protein n=1 Tax=Smallanthus sonchifolius TaxID=185202 RepID=A0ACB8XWP2_9ASTR|nr:hypothetical protein L1987_85496 [Smallanthus sonchifolius]
MFVRARIGGSWDIPFACDPCGLSTGLVFLGLASLSGILGSYWTSLLGLGILGESNMSEFLPMGHTRLEGRGEDVCSCSYWRKLGYSLCMRFMWTFYWTSLLGLGILEWDFRFLLD